MAKQWKLTRAKWGSDMSAYLIVRAEVADANDRGAFDTWYRDEHLPDAVKAFGAKRAWRGWSDVDASVHFAFYEFDDLASVRAIASSDAIKGLIAEFDRLWDGKVERTREVVENIQTIEG
jgi:hypothetical protein